MTLTLRAALLSLLVGSAPLQAQTLFIAGGQVVDVHTGRTQVASVLVRDGIIEQVSATLVPPAGATILDAGGRWVVPGLIDLHSHRTDTASLRRALALGVTRTLTIYTGAEPIPPDWEGSSMVPSSPVPSMHLVGGRFRMEDVARSSARRHMLAPSSPAQAAEDLDAYRARGVERIKIWLDDGSVQYDTTTATFSDSVLAALVRGARARGMAVYMHALTGDLYRRAIAAAPTWIIHPMVTDSLTPEDVEALRRADLGWTTVMAIVYWNADPRRYARRVLDDPRLVASLSREQVESYRHQATLASNPNAETRPRIVRRGEEYLETVRRNLRLVLASGLTVAVGSDVGAGSGTHIELELLRDAGVDPVTILRAATLGGATALGIAETVGSVEPGRIADLVLLGSNPLEEITNLRDVQVVVKGGYVWRHHDLIRP